jgi:hypothetical protein
MKQRFQAQWEHENAKKNSTPFNEWMGGRLSYSTGKGAKLASWASALFSPLGEENQEGPGDVENTRDFSGA